jgi:hypothetical protein
MSLRLVIYFINLPIGNCGTNIFYYLWFNKLLIYYCFICAVLSIITSLPIYIFSNDYVIYKDWSITTIASLDLTAFKSLHLLWGIFKQIY